MKYLTIHDSVAKQKKISILLLLLYYAAIRGEKIALIFLPSVTITPLLQNTLLHLLKVL